MKLSANALVQLIKTSNELVAVSIEHSWQETPCNKHQQKKL